MSSEHRYLASSRVDLPLPFSAYVTVHEIKKNDTARDVTEAISTITKPNGFHIILAYITKDCEHTTEEIEEILRIVKKSETRTGFTVSPQPWPATTLLTVGIGRETRILIDFQKIGTPGFLSLTNEIQGRFYGY